MTLQDRDGKSREARCRVLVQSSFLVLELPKAASRRRPPSRQISFSHGRGSPPLEADSETGLAIGGMTRSRKRAAAGLAPTHKARLDGAARGATVVIGDVVVVAGLAGVHKAIATNDLVALATRGVEGALAVTGEGARVKSLGGARFSAEIAPVAAFVGIKDVVAAEVLAGGGPGAVVEIQAVDESIAIIICVVVADLSVLYWGRASP
jgi:hypothetical protein